VNDDIFDDPEGSREEILAATYQALHEYGYSDLTIQRIGDQFDKSTSLLYYHYENKDELVLETLEFLLDSFEAQFTANDITEPREHLETFVEQMRSSSGEQRHLETLLELRARAIHDERYRRHFNRSDRIFENYLSDVIAAGVESGEFRDVDPDAVAAALVMFFNGIVLRRSTNDDEEKTSRATAEITAYLEHRLYPDAASEPAHG